jgi:hypothetical protein
MWMAGYGGRDRPSEGKLTDLWAKAMVLQDGAGERSVLLTFDLVGIGRELSLRICDQLTREFGVPRANIALCASHTHTGPVLGHNLAPLHYLQLDTQQRQLVDAYAERFAGHCSEIVGRAIEDLEPCHVGSGSGFCSVAVNRRNNPEGEVPRRRGVGRLAGPVDYAVPVLTVRRQSDDALKAIAFGYACHATVLSFYQWSGDYPGFAQSELERRHPGCTALFWAGCGADQNPLPRRSVELAEQYGQALAAAVEDVLRGVIHPLPAALHCSYQEIPLRLEDPPSIDALRSEADSSNKFLAARARMLLDRLAEGDPLPATYPYPVGSWSFGEGDLSWVFLGGEVVVDYALRLKSERAPGSTWVAGYSNDVMAYIPSRRVLREGGYEGGGAMVYYGLPNVWSPDCERLIVEEVHRQLKTADAVASSP